MEIGEKLEAFQEIKLLLDGLGQELFKKEWHFACDTCNSRSLIFHGIDLFPNVIRFYCLNCSVAGSVGAPDRKKIAKFVKQYLKLNDVPRFEFVIQRHEAPKRDRLSEDSSFPSSP